MRHVLWGACSFAALEAEAIEVRPGIACVFTKKMFFCHAVSLSRCLRNCSVYVLGVLNSFWCFASL
jgi:hypothetical protein